MEGNPVFCKEKGNYLFEFLLGRNSYTFFFLTKQHFRFTTYEYMLFVHNSVGFTPSQEVTVTTLAGLPERGANLTVSVLNHTAIDVRWAKPSK